jgi:hypothetical protein
LAIQGFLLTARGANKELEHNGIQHELISMPCRGHGFDAAMEDPEIAATFERVLKFLDLWMKP